MYHYNYKIYIFSDSTQLEEGITGITVSENLTFTAETFPFSSFSDKYLFQETAVIILNPVKDQHYTDVTALSNICAQIMKDTLINEIILCAGDSVVNGFSFNQLQVFSEIWAAPCSKKLLQYHYTKLMHRIKIERDYAMTKIYLDTTIDSIPDLVWYKNIRGVHLKVNAGFSKAVGKTKEDCEGRGHYYIWDLKEEEYLNGEYVCLETEEIVLRERKTCLFDEQVKSKEGMRQFKTYKSPVFDEFGTLVGTLGIAHDVTDFDNISAELDIILDSLPFAGLLLDADGKVVNVNDKFSEYFRISRDEVMQRDYREFCENTFGSEFFRGQESNAEVTLHFEDQVLVLEKQETQIFDVFSNAVGHFCIYRDITEHKAHMDLMQNYQKHLEADVKKQVKLNKSFQQNMIIGFADIISSRDMITGGHIKRTSKYVELLVGAMQQDPEYADNMDEAFVDHIYLSAPLHDIGKVSIPDAILLKPGKFIPSEYEIMKQHTNLGGDILDTIMPDLQDSEYYRLSKDMAKFHHERWDGLGYPQGLKGEEIPLCARIMAIADVFDALTSERPYKTAFTLEKARRIILDGRETHFDPAIVDIFVRNYDIIGAAANELNGCE